MNHTNGLASASIVLLASSRPAWAEEISSHLSSAGYRLSTASSSDDALRLQQKQKSDAIIALDNPDSFVLFESIQRETEPSNRPLLILIADAASENAWFQTADLVIPPSPSLVEHQLHLILKQRAEYLALRKQVEVLDRQNSQLRDQLNSHKRATQEVETLKNAIVRNVAHELRTPLLQVKAAVALLSEDVKDTKLIEYATDAMARLELLVKNITLLGGSLDIHPGPVIVRDAVEYTRRNLKRIWQRKDETERIYVNIEDSLPPVMADKQGLSTVLQLLLDNALKFSKDRVEVIGQREGDGVRIAVKDYGIGIARDQIDSIFDTFYQVDPSSTRRYGGTGVGLAIVRLILDHHNTQIVVESEQGKGSTFSFHLPVVKI